MPGTDTFYRIRHKYQLDDISGQSQTNEHFFVLNKEFEVAIITKEPTSYLQSAPPSTFEWAIQYGDGFVNVDFSGLDSSYFFQKYRDYKKIGGQFWGDFDYLDHDCLTFLKKSLTNYDPERAEIKRIIKAVPDFETEFNEINPALNELGIAIYTTLGKNPQTNFAVITSETDPNEMYTLATYDPVSNEMKLKGITADTMFAWTVDSAYINTNCFEHRLTFNKE